MVSVEKTYLWGLYSTKRAVGDNDYPLAAKEKEWTRKKPTAPGWYWWRRSGCAPVICQIFKFTYLNELQIQCIGTATIVPLIAAHESCEWLGPIDIPA